MARIVLVILIAAALWLGPGRGAGAGGTRAVPAHGWWIAAHLALERGDCARALELFREQVAHHRYGAVAGLGDIHETVRCAELGLPLAAELYARLIAQGVEIAQARLGHLHLHGLGVPRDAARAAELKWLARLEAGPARELYEAALKLKEGRGGLPRHEEAAHTLLHWAATKGLPEAFYTRGMWELATVRDSDDRRRALADIARAAELGYLPAPAEMGLRLAAGREVERGDFDAYWVLLKAQAAGEDVADVLAEVASRLSEESSPRNEYGERAGR